MKDIEFCECGLVKGHKQKCLSIKFGEKEEKIGKYSGKSKSENAYNDYK